MWHQCLPIIFLGITGIQGTPLPVEAKDPPPLEISLSIDQETFLVEEPFPVTVTLKNVSPDLAYLAPELDLGADFLGIECLTPWGQALRYKPWVTTSLAFHDHDLGRILAAGDSFSQRLDLTRTMGAGGSVVCTLQQPGGYTLRATYEFNVSPQTLPDLQMPRIVSRPVSFQVVSPEGQDAQARQLLYHTKVLSVWGSLPEQQAPYEAILAQYPDSAYAKYALWFLAQHHGHVLYKQYDQALAEYQRLLTIYPDFPFRDEVYLSMGRCYFHQRRYEEARKVLDELAAVTPFNSSVQLKIQGWLYIIDKQEREEQNGEEPG